jgi:hypothetical protein
MLAITCVLMGWLRASIVPRLAIPMPIRDDPDRSSFINRNPDNVSVDNTIYATIAPDIARKKELLCAG